MAMTQEPMKMGATYHTCVAYVAGLCFREYPNKIWPYMVQYLYFRILKFSHRSMEWVHGWLSFARLNCQSWVGLEMKCLMSNPCEFHYTVSASQFDMCLLNPTTLMLAGHVISHIQYHTVAILKTYAISPPPSLGNRPAIVTQLPPLAFRKVSKQASWAVAESLGNRSLT